MHPLIPITAAAAAFLLLRRDPSGSGSACPPCEAGPPPVGYGYALVPNSASPGYEPPVGKAMEVVLTSLSGETGDLGSRTVVPVGKSVDATMPNGQPGRAMMAQISGSTQYVVIYFQVKL